MEIANATGASVDLAIIGGGPSGTSAALEARRHGMRVAIWERERFPRDKVCGEFLSAESLPLIEKEIPEAVSRASFICRSEFIGPNGRAHAFDLPRPGRGLSRYLMDEALWKAATFAGAFAREGEGVLRVRRLVPATHHGANWEIESSIGSTTKASALLVACGRWWAVDGLPSPAREIRKGSAGPWMGAKAHFKDVKVRDAVEMYFFPGGYCGLAPVEDGLYNVCCMVHRSLVRKVGEGGFSDFSSWLRSVARHPALNARLRDAVQVSETVSTAPLRPARLRSVQDGTLLVGDAAGFLDPFTGDGISMALHSGQLAAREIVQSWSRLGVDMASVGRSYKRQLDGAVQRSYVVAGLLRALVSAPARLQSSAALALPLLGQRLLRETRWRAAG